MSYQFHQDYPSNKPRKLSICLRQPTKRPSVLKSIQIYYVICTRTPNVQTYEPFSTTHDAHVKALLLGRQCSQKQRQSCCSLYICQLLGRSSSQQLRAAYFLTSTRASFFLLHYRYLKKDSASLASVYLRLLLREGLFFHYLAIIVIGVIGAFV